MVKFLRYTLPGFFILLAAQQGYAQDTTATKAVDTSYKFPKAILVQLRSEHNRIAALAEAHRNRELEMVKEDASRIMQKEIADFKDHITYCPVYFYIDTNLYLVKNRKFSGVLFNADSTPASNTGLNDTSKDYLIVYYGYPAYQSRVTDSLTDNPRNANLNRGDDKTNYRTREPLDRANTNYLIETYGYPVHPTNMKDSINNKDDIGYGEKEPFGKGLIINNCRFQQVSFLYKFGYDEVLFKMRKENRKYIYISKHFDMEYFPFAEKFNIGLENIHEKMKIRHYQGEGDIWELILGKRIE